MFSEREAHTEDGRKEKGACGPVAHRGKRPSNLSGWSLSEWGWVRPAVVLHCQRWTEWCVQVCVDTYECVFFFFFFFSPAMRAHTKVDSGVKWSLYRGGRKVREGGGEGGGW